MKKGHVIIFVSYTWHKKTFPEIDELQCDADGKVYDIFRNCVIFFFTSACQGNLGKMSSAFH
jgi:hypothetical protein